MDVKSKNILLDKEYKVAKIADVGLARVLGNTVSTRGLPLGTFHYAAPELLVGDRNLVTEKGLIAFFTMCRSCCYLLVQCCDAMHTEYVAICLRGSDRMPRCASKTQLCVVPTAGLALPCCNAHVSCMHATLYTGQALDRMVVPVMPSHKRSKCCICGHGNGPAKLTRLGHIDCAGLDSMPSLPAVVQVDIYSFGVVLWEIVTQDRGRRGQLRQTKVPEECPPQIETLIDQ